MYFDERDSFRVCDDWLVVSRYAGCIDEAVLNSTLSGLDDTLAARGLPSAYAKRVYSIVVEELQNLFHHADTLPEVLLNELPEGACNYAVFCMGFDGQQFKILSGNYVDAAIRDMLIGRLEHVNSLDAVALRKYYLSVLDNEMVSRKGGGGLGLIDIARKSHHALEYEFLPVGDGYFFYTLLVTVGLDLK